MSTQADAGVVSGAGSLRVHPKIHRPEPQQLFDRAGEPYPTNWLTTGIAGFYDEINRLVEYVAT
jgi:hypothetical protein